MPPIKKVTLSTKIRSIKLYAPSIDISIDDFILKPAQPHATILRSISKALGNVDQVWPYNLKREPIETFKDVQAGQTLLVATCYFERPLAEKIREVLVIQPGAAEKAWMALEVDKKKEYVQGLEWEKIYLTLPYTEIQSRVASDVPASESCLETIEACWDLPIEAVLGLQGMVMPYGELETWEEKLLHTLAVLSEATVGQSMVVSSLLLDEVKKRRPGFIETADLIEVVEQLFRQAT